MWLLLLPALAQAIICLTVPSFPREYDTELLSFGPAPCPTLNFERYDGIYSVQSFSNPSVSQISCSLGPAKYLFDKSASTAWNSGFSPALLESRKEDEGGSLAPSLAEASQLAPPYVIFETENILPRGFTLRNYGDSIHDTTSAVLYYGSSPNGTWTTARTFSPLKEISDAQYFSLSISKPQKYWKLTFTHPSGNVFYGRDFQFFMDPLPIRILPSLGDFPNTYYPLEGNYNSFDNKTTTYQQFEGDYFTFLFFAQTYLNIDKVTGVYFSTAGAVGSYGISEFKLRPLETELLQAGHSSFAYGQWLTKVGASSGFGEITNWHENPTYTFIFSAKPVGSSQYMRLAELSLVGCPKYTCPCSLVNKGTYTSVSCSGGTACTMIPKPFVPIGL